MRSRLNWPGRMSGAFGKMIVSVAVLVAPCRSAHAESETEQWGEVGGDVGFGVLGPDLFTTFQVGLHLREGALSLGLEAALRVRTVDRQGKQESALRQEDWDEPSDFAHIIRYLTYRKDFRRLKLGLQLGELSLAEMGHGSLVSGYTSAVDLDHPHSGFRGRAVHKWFLADVLVDDFVKPEIMAARVSVKPGLRNLGIGVSGVLDIKAPVEVVLDNQGQRRVSKTRHLEVDTRVVGFIGADVEYTIRPTKNLELVPYVDANWAVRHGFGLHVGLGTKWRPGAGPWALSGGAEYRLSVDGYWPAYVDLYYDIQRYQVALGGSFAAHPQAARSKLALMAELKGIAHGGRWWAKVEYRRKFWLKAAYALRSGIVGDMVIVELGLPLSRRLVFAAVAALSGMVGGRDWKKLDGGLAASELRVRVWKHLYILGQFGYLYALDDQGVFNGVLMANAGVGGTWGY